MVKPNTSVLQYSITLIFRYSVTPWLLASPHNKHIQDRDGEQQRIHTVEETPVPGRIVPESFTP